MPKQVIKARVDSAFCRAPMPKQVIKARVDSAFCRAPMLSE